MERLTIKPQAAQTKKRLLSSIIHYMPGAWFTPSSNELVALYKQRYKMALEEHKYDAALIFLNKILEVDPANLEAKFCKGEIYHRHLNDYTRAVEQYRKIIRLTADRQEDAVHLRAKDSLTEIMEMLS
jgi:tetratricopeptide (TPR) repeat protein